MEKSELPVIITTLHNNKYFLQSYQRDLKIEYLPLVSIVETKYMAIFPHSPVGYTSVICLMSNCFLY